MNIAVISGELVANALLRGKQTKALVFVVATRQPNGEPDPIVSHVPCVIFNPPADIEVVLTTEGQGLAVELQGRVNASRFDPKEEPRSNADVVVYTKSLRLLGHLNGKR